MASKPTVVLTLAGDEKKLTEAFDAVGDASKKMARDVDSASQSMRDTGAGFDSAIEGFDTVDTRAMGFRDTVTGVSDSLRGLNDDSLSTEERLLTLGMGVGDLASGFVNLLLPALRTAWTFMTTNLIPAVWSFTSALLANPITWVVIGIAALVAAIIVLITHWDKVKQVVGTVVGWIRDRWSDLMSWFSGLPDWFGRIFGAVGGAIAGAFKAAVNFVIDSINWLLDRANWLIDRVNDITGVIGIPAIPHIPHIPRMHTGGIVPGVPGTEVPIIAMAGERVTAVGQSPTTAGMLVVSGNADSAVGTMIDTLIRNGDITMVPA